MRAQPPIAPLAYNRAAEYLISQRLNNTRVRLGMSYNAFAASIHPAVPVTLSTLASWCRGPWKADGVTRNSTGRAMRIGDAIRVSALLKVDLVPTHAEVLEHIGRDGDQEPTMCGTCGHVTTGTAS